MIFKSRSLIAFIICTLQCYGSISVFCQKKISFEIDIPKSLETTGDNRLSAISNEIRYLALEAKPNSFIKDVKAYLVSDSLIFVYDVNLTAVKIFDNRGKFIGDFLKKGKGPGEYISIMSMDMNPNGQILVAMNGLTIEIYDQKRKLFSRFSKLNPFSKAIWLSDEKILVYRDEAESIMNGGYTFEIVDRKGTTLTQLLKKDVTSKPEKMAQMTNLKRIGDGCYYWNRTCDTVYWVNAKGEISIRALLLNNGNYVGRSQQSNAYEQEMLSSGRGYAIKNYVETNRNIFISCVYKRTTSVISFSKETGECSNIMLGKNYHYPGYYNDIDKGPCFLPVISLSANSYGKWITPDYLEKFIDNYFINKEVLDPNSYNKIVYEKLYELGNPILMIINSTKI